MTKLRVVHHAAPAPITPPTRGRLIDAEEIIRRYFAGLTNPPDVDWVRRTVPHKVKLSHRKVAWYEADVEAWLEESRGAA